MVPLKSAANARLLYGHTQTYDVVIKSTSHTSCTAYLVDYKEPNPMLGQPASSAVMEVEEANLTHDLFDLSTNVVDRAVLGLSTKLTNALGRMMGESRLIRRCG